MARGVNGFKKLRKDAKKQAKSLKRSAKISLGRRATPEELRALGQYAFEQMKGGVQ